MNLTDAAHLAEMNEVYTAAAGEPFAARTTAYMQRCLTRACTSLRVPAAELPDDLRAPTGRPSPLCAPHPMHHVYGQVLQAVDALPQGVLQL
ncbi:hypothetical protein [Streptomyces shenzhenensis]|uniref:hypothetical protein n=1 Tax=Streptomyces shenzhenensis TaxID=943815 RepID=UPI0036B90260